MSQKCRITVMRMGGAELPVLDDQPQSNILQWVHVDETQQSATALVQVEDSHLGDIVLLTDADGWIILKQELDTPSYMILEFGLNDLQGKRPPDERCHSAQRQYYNSY